MILLVLLFALAGVFSSEQTNSTTSSAAPHVAEGPDLPDEITRVPLEATDGSGVAGSAEFGLVGSEQLYIDLSLHGLDTKRPPGTVYLLWLMAGDRAGYPISSPLRPDEDGSFSGRLAVPTAVALTVGGQAKSLRVSDSSINALGQQIAAAKQDQAPILSFSGAELASGDIPTAGGPGG